MPYTIILKEERDRQFALKQVYLAKIGMQVRISKPLRTAEQNARLHAMLTDVSKQLAWPPPPQNDGELHDIEWWKRRATLGWIKEAKGEVEVVTDLDGEEFGLLLPHTSDLDVTECAALILWVEMLGSTNGVKWTDPKEGPPVPESYYK